jgi:Family of unknown function (DUF6498)
MSATTPPSNPTALGRAFDLYRQTATSRSALALVIANAIPLIGVLFFGWSLLTILVLFWIENGIVGFWNVPRILMARGSMLQMLQDMSEEAAFNATGNARAAAELRDQWQRAQAQAPFAAQSAAGSPLPPPGALQLNLGGMGRAAMAGFFLIHYGIFWLVHGIFVFALPTFLAFGSPACLDLGPQFPFFPTVPTFPEPDLGAAACGSAFGDVVWSNVAIAAVALLLSHGASFFLNYIGKGEYKTTPAAKQMFAPYSRVVMLHLTIIFGAFVVAFLGAPIGALLVLVIVKTVFDLRLHLRQHRAHPALSDPPSPSRPL